MCLRTFFTSKDNKIASLIQKLQQFWWMHGFCLLVELHREGSAINKANPSSFLTVYRNTNTFNQSNLVKTSPLSIFNCFDTKMAELEKILYCKTFVSTQVEWQTDDLIRAQLEVNLLGGILLARTFLPLLLNTQGSRSLSPSHSPRGISRWTESKNSNKRWVQKKRR